MRKRALAGAIRAHDCVDFASADIEVETVEDLFATNGGGEVVDVQH